MLLITYIKIKNLSFGFSLTKKGEIELRNLEEWFDTYQFINSFELNDASFEHDTQASTGNYSKILRYLK